MQKCNRGAFATPLLSLSSKTLIRTGAAVSAALTVATCLSPKVLAQDAAASSVAYLPGIVVTAARSAQPVDRVGSAISVITAEEIERAQLTDLNEVLLRLPGVNVTPRTQGTTVGVTLRGLGPRNTLFLIDGVEIADTSEAQVQYSLRRQIDVHDIERIEVLRGPQSSLYGADSSGGVINIITKKARKDVGGTAYAEGGSYGYTRTGGSVEIVQGRLDARLSAFHYSEDGYSSAAGGLEDDPQGAEGARLNLGYDATDTLHVTGGFSVTQLNQHYDTVDGLYDANFNRIGNTAGEERNDVTKMEYAAHAGVEHLGFDGRLESKLDYGFARNERDFAYYNPYSDPTAFIDSYNGSKHKLGYVGTFHATPDHQIQFGAESEYSSLDQNTPAVSPTPVVEEDTRNDAAFVGYTGQFIDDLTVSLTGRIDHDVDFGNEITYRSSLAYLIRDTGTKLRGSYGTGFVAPSLYERFDPCIGNAEIDPEKSKGYDLGVDQSLFGGKARVSATFFHTQTEDQIDYVSLSSPQNPACSYGGIYRNVDETDSQGFEFEAAGEIVTGLSARVAYTYTDAEDKLTGADLRGVPRHRASADLNWRIKEQVNLGLGAEYRSEVITYTDIGGDVGDSYVVLSARASYDLTDTVTAYARVQNLLDRDYEEQPGYTTPGFLAYAGLRVSF
jgi:vitamin B12 transporter